MAYLWILIIELEKLVNDLCLELRIILELEKLVKIIELLKT